MTKNPFTQAAKKPKLRSFADVARSAQSSGASPSRNTSRSTGKPRSSKALAVLSPGDEARVTWTYSQAYGPGRAEFVGRVLSVDGDRIHLRDRRDVNFYTYYSMLEQIDVL